MNLENACIKVFDSIFYVFDKWLDGWIERSS